MARPNIHNERACLMHFSSESITTSQKIHITGVLLREDLEMV